MTKAEKIYYDFFKNTPDSGSDTYAQGAYGYVIINGENITILDSKLDYIINDVSLEKLKNTINQLN